ncbi:MAG TPA: APC family permease [Chitinophagaceae bacterium]|jgi:amino acid transporter
MASSSRPSVKKLHPLQLAAVIFLTVSGGPYGLEPLLSYAGSHGALLLLIITPILWDIPAIFMVLELNSMMPVTGGYYQWVKRALGLRWAFFEGWWTWLYTFADLAIYPVWFVIYLSFFFPAIGAYKIPICLVIVWSGVLLNIRGIVPVGRTAIVLSIGVLVPFVLLFVLFFLHHGGAVALPSPSLKGIGLPSMGMALYIIMWNFIGWDNSTTYAEEVDKPVRTYLISTAIGFIGVFVVYLLALIVAQQSGINVALLSDKGFPVLGEFISGHWLGGLIAAGGMASTLGLFSAVLLSVSRIPKVMSDDKLLPPVINRLHSKYNTPYVSIIICGVVVSGLVLFTFSDLVLIDVTIYGAGLLLEFISLIVLRYKAADEHRPFKIPLNAAGLSLMVLLPVSVFTIALAGAFSGSDKPLAPALLAVGALVSAEIAWRCIRLFHARRRSQ